MGWVFLLLGFEKLWSFSIYSQKDMPETTAIVGVFQGCWALPGVLMFPLAAGV